MLRLRRRQGECAERCAEAHGFSREAQEGAALEGFRRATEAAESGVTAQVSSLSMRASGLPWGCLSDITTLLVLLRRLCVPGGETVRGS